MLKQDFLKTEYHTIIILGGGYRSASVLANHFLNFGNSIHVFTDRVSHDIMCNKSSDRLKVYRLIGESKHDIPVIQKTLAKNPSIIFSCSDYGNHLTRSLKEALPYLDQKNVKKWIVTNSVDFEDKYKIEEIFGLEDNVINLKSFVWNNDLTLLATELRAFASFENEIVIKPRFSYNILYSGRFVRVPPWLNVNLNKLESYFSTVPTGEYIIQRKLHGTGVGINFLIEDGEIYGLCRTERIRTFNSQSGSCYRRIAHPNATDHSLAQKLASKVIGSGPIMIECIQGEKGSDLIPIEINPRFYGSYSLAHSFNAPFLPEQFRDDLDEKKQWGKYSRDPITDFRVIFRNGLLALLKQILLGTWQKGRKKEIWELFSFGFTLATTKFIMRRLLKLMTFNFCRIYFSLKPPPLFETSLRSTKQRVHFVCRGNINRSVVAEYYAKSIGINTISSGLFLTNQIYSSSFANVIIGFRREALNFVTNVRSEDLIVALDLKIFLELKKLGYHPVMFSPTGVVDPDGKSSSTYKKVFSDIESKIMNGNYENIK